MFGDNKREKAIEWIWDEIDVIFRKHLPSDDYVEIYDEETTSDRIGEIQDQIPVEDYVRMSAFFEIWELIKDSDPDDKIDEDDKINKFLSKWR